MRLSLIVAMADDGVIGSEGDLPWHLPADLKRFKRLTMNHHLIVGRKTFDSIGRALPGRRMIVLTRGDGSGLPDSVESVATLEEAIEAARSGAEEEAFVGGGASLYALALERADRLYLTRVHATVAGDVFFPDTELLGWELVSREDHAPDDRHEHAFSFEVWYRW